MKGIAIAATILVTTVAHAQHIEVTHVPEEQRVDVTVDGAPFTSYVYTDTLAVLKKPTLYPVHAASGAQITRYFPLQARAGERTDHPHQVGLWFSYGNVNGLDFWNNSNAVKPEDVPRMGTTLHRNVVTSEGGEGSGELVVRTDWVDYEGNKLLDESTRYVFHAGDGYRAIDRFTTLTAMNGPVDLGDNKEGLLGLRVRRELEMPVTEPIELTDANGNVQAVAVLDNEGVTGAYRNSEGISGYPDVWGKRARWTALSGNVDDHPVTIAILDHPDNVGYPTYWHARDYGLFAANPLGQKDLSQGKDTLNFKLDAGGQVTFRHRIAIFDGAVEDEVVEEEWRGFAER